MKLYVIITTYDRPGMLDQLLKDLHRERGAYELKVCVYDDGSKADYQKVIQRHQKKLELVYHRFANQYGKQGYWQVVAHAFADVKFAVHDYYYMLPDDVTLAKGFFKESIKIWEGIKDAQKMSLQLLMPKSRVGKPMWSEIAPLKMDANGRTVYRTQWNDLSFICTRSFFEALDFTIDPIPRDRWKINENVSSGVGWQLTMKLISKGFHLYGVEETLAYHGDHDSKMNYSLRKHDPLTT